MTRFKNILVPVDFTDKNLPAIQVAVELGTASGGMLTLLHVIETIDLNTDAVLQQFYDKLQKRAEVGLDDLSQQYANAEVQIHQKVRYGKRLAEIVGEATEGRFDLVVMASHRPDIRRPFETWSTLSYQVSALCQCPVLLVK
jgi:nucleotide-binding universal stress UspA family protein